MEVSEESVSNYTQLPPIAYCTIQRETETETERDTERETERERQTERARARERERERAERRKSGRRRARERGREKEACGARSHTPPAMIESIVTPRMTSPTVVSQLSRCCILRTKS